MGNGNSSWSVATLKSYFERVVRDLRLYFDNKIVDTTLYFEGKIADLKEYLVQQAKAQAEAVKAALAAAEKAVEKAEANVEKWRESQNEWRAAMSDREKEFARKSEVKAQVDHLEKLAEQKFSTNAARIDRQEQRIAALERREQKSEGKGEGSRETKTAQTDTNKYLLAVLSAIFAAIMVYISIRGR